MMMELEKLQGQWQKLKTPTYTKEELQSIYNIKQTNILGLLQTSLRLDLFISLLLATGFIILLQNLNLRSGNFWSVVMVFIGLQHLFIYLLQVILINRLSVFSGNIRQSIDLTIRKLTRLQGLYRILPVGLTLGLLGLYHLWFTIPLPTPGLLGAAVITSLVVFGISEWLSSKLIKKRLVELNKLIEDLEMTI